MNRNIIEEKRYKKLIDKSSFNLVTVKKEKLKNKKHVILKILDLRELGIGRQETLNILIKKVA